VTNELEPGHFEPSYSHLYYSVRRYFVDEFHFRRVPALLTGSCVLDLGGNKTRKRGQFNIDYYDLRVVYANLSTDKQPDTQADGAHLPFRAECFDVVICSEVLEHVSSPLDVICEIHRVLRPEGTLLICVPFLGRMHNDPYDYGRYTDHYWRENLLKIGFADVVIEKQGLFWGVLIDMLRDLVYQMYKEGRLKSEWQQGWGEVVLSMLRRTAFKWDAWHAASGHPFFTSYTTGFGIEARKTKAVWCYEPF
jgi:SAM-dependent methyltransferase